MAWHWDVSALTAFVMALISTAANLQGPGLAGTDICTLSHTGVTLHTPPPTTFTSTLLPLANIASRISISMSHML